MVLLMFHRRRRQLQTAEHVLLHLAVSTLLMMLITCPLVAASAFSHRWIFGENGCIIHGSLSYFFGIVNITALLSVSAIRYIKTCCVHTGRLNSRRVSDTLLVLVYLWAAFWSICPLLGWGSYGIEQHRLSCSLLWNPDNTGDKMYIFMAASFVIFLPIFAMAFFYVRIVITVRASHDKAKLTARKKQNRTNLNLVSLVLVLGFVLAWLPYALVSVLSALAGHALAGPGAVTVVTVLAKNSGWYNPLIYACFSQRYREHLLDLLGLGVEPQSLSDSLLRSGVTNNGRHGQERRSNGPVAASSPPNASQEDAQPDVTGPSESEGKNLTEQMSSVILETEL